MANYSRRSNTDGRRVIVERLIGEGEHQRDKPLELFNSIEDFERHKGEVDEWVKRIAYRMHMIFNDKSLIDEFAPPVSGVDLKEMSHSEIFSSLKNEVDVRLRGLQRLIEARAAPDNVIHLTRDTLPLILRQRNGRVGDAWR